VEPTHYSQGKIKI